MTRSLTVHGPLYGSFTITSPVIHELINSHPLQRLKGIAQFGIPNEFNSVESFSRFDHCVGVMLLLKKLGASEVEQIAGLLHDVAHTAFSHTIDWVVGSGMTEDYQDSQHEKYVLSTEIPTMLQRHGYAVKTFTDYHDFTLLERPSPDLCADRIDYALRESPPEIAKKCVEGLTVYNNEIVCTDHETALVFARNFLRCQMEHWGGFEAVSRYRIFAAMLRHALEIKAVEFDNFWHDDAYVVANLKQSTDPLIQKTLAFLRNKSLTGFPLSTEPEYKKFRYVDPKFISDTGVQRLSEVDLEFKRELEMARTENDAGVYIAKI